MDLGGTWLAAPADDALRRTFAQPESVDDGWDAVEVPSPGGPKLYRRHFSAPAPVPGTRAWLVFDGLVSQGDVWLDGAYLGDTDGDFLRHTFEITDALRSRREHLLAVEVVSDVNGHERSGIVQPVHVDHTGPVRARSLRVLCREATDERAVIACRAELDSDANRPVIVRTVVGDHDESAEHPVAVGSNFVEWTVTVPRPARWWPHALGDQPMHDLTVEVFVDGVRSHTVHRRVGLRSVSLRDGVFTVNGERLFVKGGAGLSPEHSRDAGLDLIRLPRIEWPAVYQSADELGVLVWQDLPDRGSRKQLTRRVGGGVDFLGHHPSVIVWFGGRAARRAAEKADGTRPVAGPGWPDLDDPVGLARLVPRFVRFVDDLEGGRREIESLRRIKYRPSGGFVLASPVDLDVTDGCRPVIVTADALASPLKPGDAVAIDVHAVSDLRHDLVDARVDALLSWPGGSHEWHWSGDVPADACVLVGTVQAVVANAPGELRLDVTLHAADHVATYGDRATVVSS